MVMYTIHVLDCYGCGRPTFWFARQLSLTTFKLSPLFSLPQLIVAGRGKVLEIFRPNPDTGKMVPLLATEVFGVIRTCCKAQCSVMYPLAGLLIFYFTRFFIQDYHTCLQHQMHLYIEASRKQKEKNCYMALVLLLPANGTTAHPFFLLPSGDTHHRFF